MNKKIKLLLDYYELEQHNLGCYSSDYLLLKAKIGYEEHYNKCKEKMFILQELIEYFENVEENEDSKVVCSKCGRCGEKLYNREFCLYR